MRSCIRVSRSAIRLYAFESSSFSVFVSSGGLGREDARERVSVGFSFLLLVRRGDLDGDGERV